MLEQSASDRAAADRHRHLAGPCPQAPAQSHQGTRAAAQDIRARGAPRRGGAARRGEGLPRRADRAAAHRRVPRHVRAGAPDHAAAARQRAARRCVRRKGGLSRRETKILLMICEGAANKFIANALGLSEATVKFHLGNIYRKLGCKKRRRRSAPRGRWGWSPSLASHQGVPAENLDHFVENLSSCALVDGLSTARRYCRASGNGNIRRAPRSARRAKRLAAAMEKRHRRLSIAPGDDRGHGVSLVKWENHR